MTQTWVNGFVDEEEIVLLRRDENGVLRARRQPAPSISFLRVEDVPDQLAHALRTARGVRGFNRVGDYYRVDWATSDGRQRAHKGHHPSECPHRYDRDKRCNHKGLFERNDIFRSYEADVSPIRRYISDHAPQIQTPRRVYLDIETDSRKTFPEAKAGKSRVLCWTLANVGRTWKKRGVLAADTDEAECELLSELFDSLLAFDQIVAWNSAHAYDEDDTFDFTSTW